MMRRTSSMTCSRTGWSKPEAETREQDSLGIVSPVLA
jgi:hypothetical protein